MNDSNQYHIYVTSIEPDPIRSIRLHSERFSVILADMITAFASVKGGTGKSTVVVNVAAELARLGRSVVIVDTDPLMTTAGWVQDRGRLAPEMPDVDATVLSGDLHAELLDWNRRYNHVLVDVGGHDSEELRSALTTAHLLVSPMRPTFTDLRTLPIMARRINEAMAYNKELYVRGVVTQAPNQSNSTKVQETRGYLQQYPEIPLFDTTLYNRTAYADAMPWGRGVVEWKDSKAKAEVQVLVQEIISL